MKCFLPVNHTIMHYSLYNQAANYNLTRYNISYEGCHVMLRYLTWYESMPLPYYCHTRSYTQKNGGKKRFLSCMLSSTRNNRNDTKYAIYEVSQNNSPDTRCEMDYTRHKVQDFYQVLIRSEIKDLRSKISKQRSSALPHIPPINTYQVPGMSYGGITRHGQSRTSIIYQVPHHNHRRWATNVNHMAGKDLVWCGWRLNFGQSILYILPVCVVLGVPWRLSKGQRQEYTGAVNRQIWNCTRYEPIGIGVELYSYRTDY